MTDDAGVAVVGCAGARSIVLIVATTDFRDQCPDRSGVDYVWTRDGNFATLRLLGRWRVSY